MRGAGRAIIGGGHGERRRPDGVGHPEREREGAASLLATHHHLALAPHGVHEALELELQRVGLGRLQHHPLDDVGQRGPGARLPVAPDPHELAGPAGQVEREVTVRLEQPETADPLARDPAGGGQRHRAIRELYPRVGDVEMGAQEREPGRPYFGGFRAAGQPQHQVEIVNHQVEHDRDIGAPRLERREPLALDVPRPVEIGLRGAKGAIVALDVPHLELHLAPRRRGDEGIGLGDRGREWLLHQHRHAAPECPKAHRRVRRRGDRDGHGLDPGQQRVEVAEGGHPQLPGHLGGTRLVGVVHPDQLGVLEHRQVTGMVPAERPDADHADRQARGHAGTPRSEDSTNARNRSTSGEAGRSLRARSSAWERLSSELKNSR